jgi:hypothetical protein
VNAFRANAIRHRERRVYWMSRARAEACSDLRRAHIAFARAAQLCFLRQVRLARKFAV